MSWLAVVAVFVLGVTCGGLLVFAALAKEEEEAEEGWRVDEHGLYRFTSKARAWEHELRSGKDGE